MDTPNCTMKCCFRCGQAKLATTEYFPPEKRNKDGLSGVCRTCAHEYSQRYYEVHADHLREYSRQYSKDHPDERREWKRRWTSEHPEKNSEYHRRGYEKHRETVLERNRKWHKANPEWMLEYSKHRPPTSPVTSRASFARRRGRKLAAEGTHTTADIRLQIKAQTDKKGHLRCWWCDKIIDKYEVDHRIPLDKNGRNDAGNLCISCRHCNRSKGNKLPHEFNGRLL